MMVREPDDFKRIRKVNDKHNKAAKKGKGQPDSTSVDSPNVLKVVGELEAAREAWRYALRGVGVFLSLDFKVTSLFSLLVER